MPPVGTTQGSKERADLTLCGAQTAPDPASPLPCPPLRTRAHAEHCVEKNMLQNGSSILYPCYLQLSIMEKIDCLLGAIGHDSVYTEIIAKQ